MSTPSVTSLDPKTLTGDYTFDVAHTTLGFVARHAMVTKVRGSFGDFDGSAHLEEVALHRRRQQRPLEELQAIYPFIAA